MSHVRGDGRGRGAGRGLRDDDNQLSRAVDPKGGLFRRVSCGRCSFMRDLCNVCMKHLSNPSAHHTRVGPPVSRACWHRRRIEALHCHVVKRASYFMSISLRTDIPGSRSSVIIIPTSTGARYRSSVNHKLTVAPLRSREPGEGVCKSSHQPQFIVRRDNRRELAVSVALPTTKEGSPTSCPVLFVRLEYYTF